MATLAVTNDFNPGDAIVASEMNANFTDIETFINTTPGVLQITGGTVTGAVTLSNTLTVGANDTGYDVKLFGATDGSYMLWDEDQDELTFIASGIGLDDNSTLELGNDNDLIIKSNNSHSFIDHNGAGGLYVRTLGAGEDIFIDAKDTLQLHTDGSAALIVEADRNITVGDSTVLAYTSFEPTLQVRSPVHIKTWSGTAGSPVEGEDWPVPAQVLSVFGDYSWNTLLKFAYPNDNMYDTDLGNQWNFSLYESDGGTGHLVSDTTTDIALDGPGAIRFYAGGNSGPAPHEEFMRVQANGDVAFGTTRAGVGHRQYYNLLFPRGGINYSKTNGQDQIWLCSNATVDAGSGWDYINTGEAGILGVDNGQAVFYSAPSGSGDITWTERFKVTNTGVLSKTSGTFDIPHPTRGGKWRLRHSFIEGPQADLIYRGTVALSNGTAAVDLDTESDMTDGTWEALCQNPWALVASSGNAVEWSLSGKTLTITSDTADAVCSWMVIGERQDDHMKNENDGADVEGHMIPEYEKDMSNPFPETEAVEEPQPANLTEPPPVAAHAAA